jgi:hypothetical protein
VAVACFATLTLEEVPIQDPDSKMEFCYQAVEGGGDVGRFALSSPLHPVKNLEMIAAERLHYWIDALDHGNVGEEVSEEEKETYCLCHDFPQFVLRASLEEAASGNDMVAAFDFPSLHSLVAALGDQHVPLAWKKDGGGNEDEIQIFAGAFALVVASSCVVGADACRAVGHAVDAAACQDVRMMAALVLLDRLAAALVALHSEDESAFLVECLVRERDGGPCDCVPRWVASAEDLPRPYLVDAAFGIFLLVVAFLHRVDAPRLHGVVEEEHVVLVHQRARGQGKVLSWVENSVDGKCGYEGN